VGWCSTVHSEHLMGRGSEGHAGRSESRQGQPRMHETHFERLADEHDEAARAVKQRRAGSRFRYRRRRQAHHCLQTTQDTSCTSFIVSFFASLWVMLVAAGVSTPIGTTAFGSDTESGWTSVRTAVETSRFTPTPSSCNSRTQPHSFSAHNLPQQLLASAAPTRRSAILAHGLPSPT
jgi:hypothetical protein